MASSVLSSAQFFDFVIIGGGIAGVVCTETLCELINPGQFSGGVSHIESPEANKQVALISATKTIKNAINLRRITNLIETFEVEETLGDVWSKTWPNTLKVIYDIVVSIDPSNHLVYLQTRGPSQPIHYGRLCLATGGVPRLVDSHQSRIITLRDTESLNEFQRRLKGIRRLLLVGNGGIATEIAYEVNGCQIIWAIKDANISAPFIDPAAARFLLNSRRSAEKRTQSDGIESGDKTRDVPQIRRMRYIVDTNDTEAEKLPADAKGQFLLVPDSKNSCIADNDQNVQIRGAALGPDWAYGRDLQGLLCGKSECRQLKVVYEVKVCRFLTPVEYAGLNKSETDPFPTDDCDTYSEWPLYVELTNGEIYGCDLVVSAVGVNANFCPIKSNEQFLGTAFNLKLNDDGGCGGLLVDEQMLTNVPDIYAAGDCAFANWNWAPHWFQMKLWSQARQMGFQAAKCMFQHSCGRHNVPLDFTFELFTHVTYFFGFKIVLLGCFNSQGMDLTSPDSYLLMRITSGDEYVKCVMQAGRMQGAILIGETDLEETFEHLIVDQLDLTNLEEHLLDPDIDLSDYFD